MQIRVCRVCHGQKGLEAIPVHDYCGAERDLVELVICKQCLAKDALFCPTHEVRKVYVLDTCEDGAGQNMPVLLSACHRCAWDQLRTMDEQKKRFLLLLLAEPGDGSILALLPREDAALLEPLSEEDRTMYGLIFSKELYKNDLEEIVSWLILSTREESVLMN